MKSLDPHEDRPAFGARGAAMAQIGSHRFPDVGGRREALGAVALAVHDDLARSPIDMVELKCRDFARPQPETDERGQDRHIPATSTCLAVTGRQHPVDLVRLHAFRQSC